MTNLVKYHVINAYSKKENLDFYKKIGLWKAEKILFQNYFSMKGKLLDIGCGGGRTTIPLARMGCKVVAFDITPKLVKIAKQNAKRSNAKARIELGDATNMKYPDNSFNYALFSFNGIEAIPGKNKRFIALQNIYRVLKPEGMFIFTTNTTAYLNHYDRFFIHKEFLKFLFSNLFRIKNKYSRLKDFEFGDCFLGKNHSMYIHFSRIKNVKKELRKIGFTLIYSEFREIIEKKEKPNLRKDYFYVCKKN